MKKPEVNRRVAMAIAQDVKITGPMTARNAPLVKKIARKLLGGSTGYQRENQQAPWVACSPVEDWQKVMDGLEALSTEPTILVRVNRLTTRRRYGFGRRFSIKKSTIRRIRC